MVHPIMSAALAAQRQSGILRDIARDRLAAHARQGDAWPALLQGIARRVEVRTSAAGRSRKVG